MIASPFQSLQERTMKSSSNRRKKALIALGAAAWLLMLGGISYYLCLPDLDEMSRGLRAIREDPNLTPEEKIAKSREIYAKLTRAEGRQVFQDDFKKWHHERNAEMQKFLKMSAEEQAAHVKKQDEERKRRGPIRFFIGGGGAVQDDKGGGVRLANGGSGPVVAGGGAGKIGGAGAQFIGPGGGPGKKTIDPKQIQKTMLDNFSPETRAGMSYQRGLSSPSPP
jgi:hypothetical protein